jgi:hypothetical protein
MADKRINELEEALSLTPSDLFVLQQANTAKKMTGQTMTNFLLALANGHGGIASIAKTGSAGTDPVVDTYTITFADSSTTTFTVTNGLKGDQGIQGVQGPAGADVTITSTSVQYQAWTSGTEYPTGTWVNSPPAVSQGNYLWTRTIVNYSDGAQTVSYSVARMGVDGSGAVSTVCGISPDGSGNVALTPSDVGALPASYQAPVISVNGYNGDVNLRAADVSAVPVSGSDGFLYRSSNAIGQKKLKKSLWSDENGWNSGNITVQGLSDYSLFLIRSNGNATMIMAAMGCDTLNASPTTLRGVGGLHDGSPWMFYFDASVSGNTLTFGHCYSVYGSGSPVARKVIEIIGVI